MESRSHALIAGIFTIALFAAVLLSAWWVGADRTDLVPFVMETELSVAGLYTQAPVKYRGLQVGKVSSLRFDPDNPGKILVFFGIDPATPMTQSTYATLAMQGVTGFAYIELDDDNSNPQPLRSSEKNVARIEMRPSLLALLQTKASGILDETQKTTEALASFSKPENQKVLIDTLRNINRAASEIATATNRMQPALAALPEVVDKSGKMIDSVTALSDEMQQLSQTMNALVDNSDTVDALAQVQGLITEMQIAAQTFNDTMDQFRQRPVGLLLGGASPPPGPGEQGHRPQSR